MPQYARSSLRTRAGYKTKGTITSTQSDGILNEAVREVIADIDLVSTKRRARLSLNNSNDIANESVEGTYNSTMRSDIVSEMDKYFFHAPHDLKGNGIVDIQKRVDTTYEWSMITPEEFMRRKNAFANEYAVDNHSFMRKILASGIKEITKSTIHNCDTYDGNGTWADDTAQIIAVSTTTDNYVEGIGAIGFTCVDGVMAGGTLTISDMTAVDLSSTENHSLYMWVYIPVATGLTSFGLKWGSDASNYWSRTVTKNHDNCAFHVGWNLLRFPWADATETGTADETAIDYLQLTVIKGASNTGETGWMIDGIIAATDSEHDAIYYSEYGWQNATGVYLQEASQDTDLVNADNEEVDLILAKYAELISEFIDDQAGVVKFKTQYEDKKYKYGQKNPSERKLITTTYQGIASIDNIKEYITND